MLIPQLSHADRHIRYAARVALERIPTPLWQTRVLAEDDPDCVIGGVVAWRTRSIRRPNGAALGTRPARLQQAHGAAAVGLFASLVAGLHSTGRA